MITRAHNFEDNNRRRGTENHHRLQRLFIGYTLTVLTLQNLGLQAQVKEQPSNEEVGVDVDRFIGHPSLFHPQVTHETIIKRQILVHGDPYKPGERAAVLEFRKDFAYGTLWPGNRTPLIELPDQQIFYIEGGTGRLDNGRKYWELSDGTGVLIPPGILHRFTNTGDKPLEMLILTWKNPEGVTPRSGILVRDVHVLPLWAKNGHWAYISKALFTSADGLHPGESFSVIWMPPMTIGAPHPHIPNWEEVWVKLPPYDSYLFLGSEVRDMPPNTAFLVPPNGKITHSVMNLTKDKTQMFLGYARFAGHAGPRFDLPSVAAKPLRDVQ